MSVMTARNNSVRETHVNNVIHQYVVCNRGCCYYTTYLLVRVRRTRRFIPHTNVYSHWQTSLYDCFAKNCQIHVSVRFAIYFFVLFSVSVDFVGFLMFLFLTCCWFLVFNELKEEWKKTKKPNELKNKLWFLLRADRAGAGWCCCFCHWLLRLQLIVIVFICFFVFDRIIALKSKRAFSFSLYWNVSLKP